MLPDYRGARAIQESRLRTAESSRIIPATTSQAQRSGTRQEVKPDGRHKRRLARHPALHRLMHPAVCIGRRACPEPRENLSCSKAVPAGALGKHVLPEVFVNTRTGASFVVEVQVPCHVGVPLALQESLAKQVTHMPKHM